MDLVDRLIDTRTRSIPEVNPSAKAAALPCRSMRDFSDLGQDIRSRRWSPHHVLQFLSRWLRIKVKLKPEIFTQSKHKVVTISEREQTSRKMHDMEKGKTCARSGPAAERRGRFNLWKVTCAITLILIAVVSFSATDLVGLPT
jgi:hypothetical protein